MDGMGMVTRMRDMACGAITGLVTGWGWAVGVEVVEEWAGALGEVVLDTVTVMITDMDRGRRVRVPVYTDLEPRSGCDPVNGGPAALQRPTK